MLSKSHLQSLLLLLSLRQGLTKLTRPALNLIELEAYSLETCYVGSVDSDHISAY